MGWLSGWNYRQKLTIDHTLIDADCTNFPVKVIVPFSNELFNKAKADGSDVRFTASDGATLLDFEREVHLRNGLLFDGVDDYVSLPSLGLSIYTIEFWVQSPSKGFFIQDFGKSGYAVAFLRNITTDELEFRQYDKDIGTVVAVKYTGIDWSVPHYISGVNTGSELQLYVDGVFVGATPCSFSLTTGTTYLFKDNISTLVDWCSGAIWDMKIWNSIRTQTEIQSDMYTTLTGTETGLVAYYKFNEGAGTTLTDYAGGNDGTIHGGATWINNTAVYHVKIPLVSSTSDTDFYMYYGNASATDASNASAVWDSSYELVMHMGGALQDSTNNNNDGTNHGSALGLAGDGYYRSFDGANDYIAIADSPSLDITSNITVEIYTKINYPVTSQTFISKDEPNNYSAYCLDISPDVLRFFGYEGSAAKGIIAGANTPAADTAYLVYGRKDGSDWVVGRDGVPDATKTEAATLNNTAGILSIGARFFAGKRQRWFQGSIYEIRISSTARSDAWIKATNYTLQNQLLTIGPQEMQPTIVFTFNTPIPTVNIGVSLQAPIITHADVLTLPPTITIRQEVVILVSPLVWNTNDLIPVLHVGNIIKPSAIQSSIILSAPVLKTGTKLDSTVIVITTQLQDVSIKRGFTATSPQVVWNISVENPAISRGANFNVSNIAYALNLTTPLVVSGQKIIIQVTRIQFLYSANETTLKLSGRYTPTTIQFSAEQQDIGLSLGCSLLTNVIPFVMNVPSVDVLFTKYITPEPMLFSCDLVAPVLKTGVTLQAELLTWLFSMPLLSEYRKVIVYDSGISKTLSLRSEIETTVSKSSNVFKIVKRRY